MIFHQMTSDDLSKTSWIPEAAIAINSHLGQIMDKLCSNLPNSYYLIKKVFKRLSGFSKKMRKRR